MPTPYQLLKQNLTELSLKHARLTSIEAGICFGLTATLVQNALIQKQRAFEKRLKSLCKDFKKNNLEIDDRSFNSLADAVDYVQDKIKNNKTLSKEEEFYFEMLPLFETVTLYHVPGNTELADKISGQDISKTLKYAMSLALEKKFENKDNMVFPPVYNQQAVISPGNDPIPTLLKTLKEKGIDNYGITFQSHYHTIGVVDVDGHPMIFDANFLHEDPPVVYKPYDTATLLKSLLEAKCAMNINIFVAPEDYRKIQHQDLHEELIAKNAEYKEIYEKSCKEYAYKNKNTNKSLIFFAAHSGNFSLLKKLLTEYPVDVNQKSLEGETPLWVALRGGSVACVNLLLQKGAAVNVTGTAPDTGLLPIHFAAKKGNKELLGSLLEYTPDINISSADSKTPLWFAVESGSVECTQLLLDKGASPNVKAFDKEKNKVTMLFQAVQQNNVELVKLLLNKGANSSEPSFYKGNNLLPIHMAIQNNNFSMVQLLLDDYTKASKEAAVNLCDSNGTSALMFAAAQSHVDVRIVELLLSHKMDINLANNDSATALSIATKNKAYDVMALLLNHHAAVNVAWGASPLMEAADNGDIKALKILLENKTIDINYKSPLEHKTALSIAISNGDMAAAQLLISAGAAVDNSLILDAARSGNPHILSLVLDKIPAADLNVERNNITPLIAVVQKGNSEMVTELIKAGADVNYQTRNGNTALMKAASMGNVEMLTQLLESKADVALVNQRGETALLSAVLTGQAEAAATLLAVESDVPAFIKKLLMHIQAGILNTDWSKQVTRSDKMTISTQNIEKEVPSVVAAVFVEVNKALHTETSAAYYQGLTQVARLLEDQQKNSNRTSVLTRYFKSAPRWNQECDDWLQQINLISEPLAAVLKQNEQRPTKS